MRLKLPLLALLGNALLAQYAPIDLPTEWTFRTATPAYSIASPREELGHFQPGITVDVVGSDPDNSHWRVVFKRYGQPDIECLVEPPDLSKARHEAFARVEADIAGFPLLRKLLEAAAPWPERPEQLARVVFGNAPSKSGNGSQSDSTDIFHAKEASKTGKAWGLTPLSVAVNYRQADNPMIVVEFWNKGDAFQTALDPSVGHRELQERFTRIQEAFRTYREDPAANSAASAITAIRMKEEVFLLPNDLRVALRYDRDEYLLLTFQSISHLDNQKPETYDPNTFKQRIAGMVRESEAGHRYIGGIPMIDQGDKGYCAAATLARVLQYYGYAVDQHALADLAETEAQLSESARGGTLRENIIDAMSRICGSTPFRLKEIREEHPKEIREVIDRGIPIIWFIPGHARLLIGIHPQNNQIVYSDSWGPEHAYKTETWDYFVNANREMWYLTPR